MGTQEIYRFNNETLESDLIEAPASQLMVHAMETLGIRAVFGIPGGAIAGLFYHLDYSEKIRLTLTQHEGGAAYMALGRSLVSGTSRDIGVCFATSGPGITNLISGIAAAYEERVPMLAITGNVATHLKNKGAAQDAFEGGINATRMLEPITARSVVAKDGLDAIQKLIELFFVSLRERKPVHLNLPINTGSEKVRVKRSQWMQWIQEGERSLDIDFNRTQAQNAAQAFLAAERPMIFAGNGVKTSGLSKDFRSWVEALQIPVVVDSHARGILNETHPYLLGTFGLASPEATQAAIQAYRPDAILYLGTRLGETATNNWSPLVLDVPLKIHVDLDPTQLGKVTPTQFPLRMRIEDFVPLLISESEGKNRARITFPRGLAFDGRVEPFSEESLIHPRHLMQVLDLDLPKNAIILCDIGNTMAWAFRHLRLEDEQELFIPIGFGAMGSSLCASIGIKSRFPDRPVICLTGDCAALMHGNELWTAVNAGIGVKWIVLNDSGHGMVDQGMKMIGYPKGVHVRFQQPMDFVTYASSMGVLGYRASTMKELLSLPLADLLLSPGPTVLDLSVDPTPLPPITARHRVLGMTEVTS